jgi:anaphase-promoting complex subunit 2
VDCLQLARRIYLTPVVHYVLPLIATPHQSGLLAQLQRAFHTVVSYSLPWQVIAPLLASELTRDAVVILGIDTFDENYELDTMSVDEMEVERTYSVSYKDWRQETAEARAHMMVEGEDRRVTIARDQLLAFLNGLQLVGLGADKAQKVFAEVMNILMGDFITAAYSGEWESPSTAPQHLGQWIENVYARLAVQVLSIIHSNAPTTQSGAMDVSFGDVEKWRVMGTARLGMLRVGELFDVVVDWPASSGAVEDLRHFVTQTRPRAYVTHWFSLNLQQRLLHPGASTVEILQVYISVIRAFHLLDPNGVLLDRIARPIRRYLRDRDDTVKVIVSGLLADPATADDPSTNDTLAELASELTRLNQHSMQNKNSELDFDDLNWLPDPVDAAPDYRKSKSADVIDSLVSLFDSKETFVKEMQTLLADRLIQKRQNYDQETTVLELLKVRFGDAALQACEVMLKDLTDSRRLDHTVRQDQISSGDLTHEDAQLHAKILSRFFWPEFQDQEFKVPDEITTLQTQYASCFEKRKDSRKLKWHNALGQVTVELELENHSFRDEVTTWQATVIYAFQSDSDSDSDSPATKTIPELASELEMTIPLVRSACLFWVSKRILSEVQRDTFQVQEVLADEEQHDSESDSEDEDTANAAAAAEAAAAAAAKESAEAAAMEKMNVHWQFIVGMLTNQGPMPLARIVMMLKIAVPGGFPFSNEELREFLGGMVSKGKLEIVNGGNYKIVH